MTAYFIITHGSRSPRSVVSRQKIEAALQKRCPTIPIGGGCLEGQEQSLREQMVSFAKSLSGRASIIAIPLFLLKGFHTQIDIPAQIPDDGWQLAPLLGKHPQMTDLLRAQFPAAGERVLLCHGSNYPGAVAEFEILAQTIGAKPAYWQGEPSWQRYAQARGIYLLPYFLAGSYILDKIKAQTVNLLPTPLTPEIIAQMTTELVEGLK